MANGLTAAPVRPVQPAVTERIVPRPSMQAFDDNQLKEATALAERWLAALRAGDVHTLRVLSGFPLVLGGDQERILTSVDDFEAVRRRRSLAGFLGFQSNTVAEWKRLKVLSGLERVFGLMAVRDSDVVVIAVDKNPSPIRGLTSFVVRLEPDGLWKVRAHF